MATQLAIRIENRLKSAKFTHMRASAYYRKAIAFRKAKKNSEALASISTSISKYHDIWLPPLRAYAKTFAIKRDIFLESLQGGKTGKPLEVIGLAAKKLEESEAHNWRIGRIHFMRALLKYDAEAYGEALKDINASIQAFHKIPVPAFGAYNLKGMIQRKLGYELERARRNVPRSPLHEEKLAKT